MAAYAPGIAKEFAVIVVCVVAYFGVRGLTEGNADLAMDNAVRVVDVERNLGLFHEQAVQDTMISLLGSDAPLNMMYIWGHWPVILVMACWLMLYRPRTYSMVRNAFIISGAIGLVIFATFPVAPPRLSEFGFEDTVTAHSDAYRVLQPPAFVNQYAAMPSLHFGWNLLIGGALAMEARWRLVKVVSIVLPIFMAVAVVATANHFILDVIAGGFVALLGLIAAMGFQRWRDERLQVVPDE